MLKADLVREFRMNEALRAASGIVDVKVFEAKLNEKRTQKRDAVSWAELQEFFFKKDENEYSLGWWTKLDKDGKLIPPKKEKNIFAIKK